MAIDRVLIIDENESNLLFFQMALEEMDRSFVVFTATTGPQAEILVRTENVQFIICAWEMSPMPGTVLVQKLKENRSRHIPCLIFSKRMAEDDAVLVREMGLHDVLGMPFDKENAKTLILNMMEAEDHISPIEKKLRKVEAMVYEGKLTEALKLIDNSVTKEGPHLGRAMTALGEIWLGSRNLQKAKECLDKALAEDEENIHAHRLIAKYYSLMGEHDKAIEMLEKMTEKSPKNLASLISLGSAYIEADDHDSAMKILQRVDEMDEDFQPTKDEKGKIAFKEGDLGLAAQLLAETKHGDELARNFNNIAIAKVANEQYDEGIETYKSAIQLLNDKAKLYQLYFNLGLAFRKKGDMADAFSQLCASYIDEPSFDKAYNTLAKLSTDMKDQGLTPDPELVKQVKDARNKQKSK